MRPQLALEPSLISQNCEEYKTLPHNDTGSEALFYSSIPRQKESTSEILCVDLTIGILETSSASKI